MAITVIGVYFAFSFAMDTFRLPLMGDHCMKTSKNVEVAYNLVRYRDPFHSYVDYKATPKNPTGKLSSILRYETPLSGLLLGGIYAVFDGKDFDRRVAIARYFTLFHLIAGYLLLSIFVFRSDRFALVVFTFTFIGSAFTVSYSTKPLPETYAIFYQALFIVLGVYLMRREMGPIKKSLCLGGLCALLSIGGKLNYFLIAAPIFIVFPFFDTTLVGVGNKLKYFGVMVVGGGLAVLGMLLFTKISFYDALVYMVKGNKEIINNSLYETFMEGFDALDDIIERTRNDFGKTAYDWGKYSCYYLGLKLLYLALFKRKSATEWERFSVMTALFVLGHALNYIVLRNLFIPHRYYVVPLYLIFCLAITTLLADVRQLLSVDVSKRTPHLERVTSFFYSRSPLRFFKGVDAAPYRGALMVALLFAFMAIYAGYMAETLSTRGWQNTILLAMKAFGSTTLTFEIKRELASLADRLQGAMVLFAVLSGGMAAAAPLARFVTSWRRVSTRLDGIWQRAGVNVVNLSMIFTLSFPATFWALKNGKMFYRYADSHTELIEWAEALAEIRKDTQSGALVLAWKVCVAFYADKRSIRKATPKDIDYYRKHNLPSVMGPVRPLNIYYRRIEKYPPPMSYWVPKTSRPTLKRTDKRK